VKRQTATTTLEAFAECGGCDWRNAGRGALGSAARHHDATGHPVTITTTNRVEYGTAADRGRALEERGQETMQL
jgi:hypothetical protein